MKRTAQAGSLLVALLICIGLGSQSVWACSCAPASLESRYERSDNVFTAVITGAKATDEIVEGLPKVENYFELTELFKGTLPFDYLRSHTGGASCGIALEIGVEYLIFTSDSGRVGLCSGLAAVSPNSTGNVEPGRKYVDALRAFKSGKHDSLAEPWFFHEDRGVCRLTGGFPYGERKWSARISVTYWPRIPDGVVLTPDKPHLKAGYTRMTIWVPDREDLTNHPLTIDVNGQTYSANWRKPEHTSETYIVDSDDVPALISELVRADDLKMSLAHPTQGKIKFAASLINAGDSVEKMLECLGRD